MKEKVWKPPTSSTMETSHQHLTNSIMLQPSSTLLVYDYHSWLLTLLTLLSMLSCCFLSSSLSPLLPLAVFTSVVFVFTIMVLVLEQPSQSYDGHLCLQPLRINTQPLAWGWCVKHRQNQSLPNKVIGKRKGGSEFRSGSWVACKRTIFLGVNQISFARNCKD